MPGAAETMAPSKIDTSEEPICSVPAYSKSSTCPIQLPILSSSSFKDRALVCLSHLRWDLVFQRPQHLMARFAQAMPVYFVEEPAFEGADSPRLQRCEVAKNLTVLVTRMPVSMATADATSVQKRLVSNFFSANLLRAAVLWFYTPAALQFADELPAAVTVFDCMDELSSFQGASPELHRLEAKLLSRADVVFTGGISLYEAKHGRHHNVHAFPSAVDAAHFATARKPMREPADQRAIPHPRLGFFGVIDERLDRDLVADVARLRPDWQLILIGPIVKINAADLPQAPNLHYLGRKTMANFRLISRVGTRRSCHSPKTRRLVSSVLPKRRNTLQQESPWCRRRSST
jgi:UDP-galactopyranose mutase